MNRKSSPANNFLRIAAAVVFIAILAINASGEEGLQRFTMPIVVLLVIGLAVVRIVFQQFGSASGGDTSAPDATRKLALVMTLLGLAGAGAAVYFLMGQGEGVPALRELFRWAPLAGAWDAVSEWGGLLIVGGLVGVGAAVALIVVLRRAGELPDNGSSGWNSDDDRFSG